MKDFSEWLEEQKDIPGWSNESDAAEKAWRAALKHACEEFEKRGIYGADLLLDWSREDT